MKVRIHDMVSGETVVVPDVSKAMTVKKFKKLVFEATKIESKLQNLFFGGKMMNDNCDLCDYKIEDGYKIMLQKRQPLEPVAESSNKKEPSEKPTEDKSEKPEVELSKEEQRQRLIGKKKYCNTFLNFEPRNCQIVPGPSLRF